MSKTRAQPARKTRIQNQNEQVILDAALQVFASAGFRGATVDQIAIGCGLSKPNLLYYFRRKEDIYIAILERTLKDWLAPLQALDENADPFVELTRYITAKLDMSLANPAASRLFANEILHGAPHIGNFLKGPLKDMVDGKATVLSTWAKQGKIKTVDPYHFIFAIWAVTQHYADFSVQVELLRGPNLDREETLKQVLAILLGGLKQS
jgi:TetR/AcrR family transcriptional regulator